MQRDAACNDGIARPAQGAVDRAPFLFPRNFIEAWRLCTGG